MVSKQIARPVESRALKGLEDMISISVVHWRMLEHGWTFEDGPGVVPDPNLVYASGYGTDAAPASAVINNYVVTGGTNIVGGFYLGSTNGTGLTTVNFTNGGAIYVGSQGIVSNGAATVSVSLNNGGLFGATAPWTSSTRTGWC